MFDALSSSAESAPGAAQTRPDQPVPRLRGFGADLRDEFRRLARAPRDDVSILAFNALLVAGCWFLLPSAARDWLFELHGPLAFAFVLQSWMLADTPATNPLGNDVSGAMAALPDRGRLRRLLRVKASALACVVGAVSALAGLIVAFLEQRYAAGLATTAVLLTLPFGTAAVAQWLGILLPYQRRSMHWRWAHRRPWGRTVRWLALVVVPFMAVPLVSAALVDPAAAAPAAMGDRDRFHHLTGSSLLMGAVLACLVAGLAYLLASRAGAWLAVRRAPALQSYLPDPESG
jgi:hypothetical protein